MFETLSDYFICRNYLTAVGLGQNIDNMDDISFNCKMYIVKVKYENVWLTVCIYIYIYIYFF